MSVRRVILALTWGAGVLLPCTTWAAERVVTLSPHLAELVCAAGACGQLVGTVAYSDYPERVRSLPQVGDSFAVNGEQLLRLKPTRVLAWDGGTPTQTLAQIRRLGLPLELIRVRSLDDIGHALLRIGALLQTEAQARTVEAEFRNRIATLRAQYANTRPIRVFFQLESDPMFTVNRDSPISEAIALCGGRNLFDAQPRIAGSVGREAVLGLDPDVIVFGQQEDVAAIVARWKRFPRMAAVRADNLVAVDADKLARATPRMAEGIAGLCAALDQARARLALKH
jgi:iron complex transport system substrate-binding protein